jgi:23S rRNA (guanosine2251-2'-O)-methyltransferase
MNSSETNILYGRNPVREALRSGREADSLYIQDSIENNIQEIIALAKRRQIPVKMVPRNKIDSMVEFETGEKGLNHQGVVLRVPSVSYSTLEDAVKLAEEREEPLFLIALDGIEDPHNLGAIVRSAEIFGAHGVVIPKRRSAGMSATASKSASGAEEYIPIIRVGNLVNFIDEVKKKGVFVAAADMDGQSLYRSNLKGAMMIIVGSEGQGISRLVRERSDFIVSIDMYGHINSLNASSAAAVIMYEKKRQDVMG